MSIMVVRWESKRGFLSDSALTSWHRLTENPNRTVCHKKVGNAKKEIKPLADINVRTLCTMCKKEQQQ